VANGAQSRRCMVGKFAVAPLPTFDVAAGEFAHPTDARTTLRTHELVRAEDFETPTFPM